MFLQDFQSPGEKNEADVCDDLIKAVLRCLHMQSSISLDLASKSVFMELQYEPHTAVC